MTPADRAPKLHLISGLAFLLAGILFMMLAFTNPNAHRLANLPVGVLFLGAALLQVLAYRKKRRT